MLAFKPQNWKFSVHKPPNLEILSLQDPAFRDNDQFTTSTSWSHTWHPYLKKSLVPPGFHPLCHPLFLFFVCFWFAFVFVFLLRLDWFGGSSFQSFFTFQTMPYPKMFAALALVPHVKTEDCVWMPIITLIAKLTTCVFVLKAGLDTIVRHHVSIAISVIHRTIENC